MHTAEVAVGQITDLEDPGCREFQIGEGDWPFRDFIVRQGENVHAYRNYCLNVGHPLTWIPDGLLTKDGAAFMCASHGALYEIGSGVCFAGPCMGKSLRVVNAEVRDATICVTGPVSM